MLVWRVVNDRESAASGLVWKVDDMRAGGGIGRRARFRSVCPKGRGGSTPPSRTTEAPGLTCGFVHVRA